MLIHIGYHKTGTTWLQERFFPVHPQISTPFSYQEIVENIVYPHDLNFSDAFAKSYFEPKLRQIELEGRIAVFSAERLSGNPHSGGYDSKVIADRLYAVFPNAKIWIVLRNQIDMIVSNYKQYVKEGGMGQLSYYLKMDPPERIPSFRFEHFEYADLIKYYQEKFGKDKVLVSFYEDFKISKSDFIKDLCNFIRIDYIDINTKESKDINESFSDLSTIILRPLNAFSYYPSMAQYPVMNLPGRKFLRNILKIMDRIFFKKLLKKYFRNKVVKIIGDRYIKSNNELEKAHGVKLNKSFYV